MRSGSTTNSHHLLAKLTAKFGYSFHTAILAENVDDKLIGEIDGHVPNSSPSAWSTSRRESCAMIRKDNKLEKTSSAMPQSPARISGPSGRS